MKTTTPPTPSAQSIKWFRSPMPCGTTRHLLYINGTQSPWFVDVATVRAHFTEGNPVGLFGAGMSEPNSRGQRHAACFGSFRTIKPAMALAESIAQPLAPTAQ